MNIVAKFSIAALTVMWTSVAYAAGPEGQFIVTGTDPGNTGSYGGTVNVVAKGKAYDVVWKIGNARFTGVGVYTDRDFSVAYYGSNLTGVAVYRRQADGTWNGVWAVKGSGRLGSEVWTPR